MPYELQVKLLNVLQTGEFYRVGGTKKIKVDVRIIAATNTNILQKIEQKEFRKDLYYRLNVVSFNIPPLSERRDDIPVLVDHICSQKNKKYNTSKIFSPKAVDQLMKMKLNGNVRELENIIERNMIFSLEDIIQKIMMYDELDEPKDADFHISNSSVQDHISKRRSVDDTTERRALINAYKELGTTTAMAQYFGVSQSTISRRLKKHGINRKKSSHFLYPKE